MPSELEHLDKWKHNRSFLPKIDEKYSDWRASVAFYAALHAVEAFFAAKHKRDCHTHEERDAVIQRDLAAVYRDYYQLYSVSRLARYMVFKGQRAPIFEKFMSSSQVAKVLIGQRLQRLEQHIIREIALKAEEFPPIFN